MAIRDRMKGSAERRGSDRFPIDLVVRYKVLSKRVGQKGRFGNTINISSNGILFTIDQPLVSRTLMELSISWPRQLDNKCQLQLIVRGRVARLEDGRAVIEIKQYEFRIQPTKQTHIADKTSADRQDPGRRPLASKPL